IDSNMPGTDGAALVGRIRDEPRLRDVRLVMLSSSDHRDDAARRRDLKMDGFLIKPVKPSELLQAITAALLPSEGEPQEVVPAEPPTGTKPLRILLVEDNLVNQ